jgi:pimeloyl-ACP methyl ester carboxylesterase
MTAHQDAVLEFAYDWRLAVADNARLLAQAVRAHLDAWRRHPIQELAREVQPDNSPAQVVLVAHSMGGLVVRALPLVDAGIVEDVRATVTLGTPFRGSAKTMMALATGQNGALPKLRLASLARKLPGIYDLLPTYRCVDTGDDVRHLTNVDIAKLGGDDEQATRARSFHQKLDQIPMVGHLPLLGVEQPTVSLLRIQGSTIEELAHTVDVNTDGTVVRDRHSIPVHRMATGDGTVPDHSADFPGTSAQPLAQQHGALAQVDEAISVVRWVVTRKRSGGRLGADLGIGITAPDVAEVGSECRIGVHGSDGPLSVSCSVVDAETGITVDEPRMGNDQHFVTRLPREHLYRVVVTAGGGSPVTRMVLGVEPGADG